MSTFDKDYFFIMMPEDERLPDLEPDEDTFAKSYSWKVSPIGSKPFIFYNGSYERQKRKHIISMSPPPDVLFDGSNLLVIDRIADKLQDFEIPNLAIQPAIFIDHKDNWYENYWFLTFTELFDCWDRDRSEYPPEPIHANTKPPLYSLYVYSLNEDLLQNTPLAERRLFKMGGTTAGHVVAHKSIVNLFRVKGVDIVPLTDYGVNYP